MLAESDGSPRPPHKPRRDHGGAGLGTFAPLLAALLLVPTPAPAFEADTHYAWTYYLALHVGFSERQAYQIASATYAIDKDPDTGPLEAGPVEVTLGAEAGPLPYNPRIAEIWRRHHCFAERALGDDTGQFEARPVEELIDYVTPRTLTVDGLVAAARSTRAQWLWLLAIENRNPGAHIHFIQDCFAHYDFSDLRGHVMAGHAPDFLSHDPERSREMTRETLSALARFMLYEVGRAPRAVRDEEILQVLDLLIEVNPVDAWSRHNFNPWAQPGDRGVPDLRRPVDILRDAIRQDLAGGKLRPSLPQEADAAGWFDARLPYAWVPYGFDSRGHPEGRWYEDFAVELPELEMPIAPSIEVFPASGDLVGVSVHLSYRVRGLAPALPFPSKGGRGFYPVVEAHRADGLSTPWFERRDTFPDRTGQVEILSEILFEVPVAAVERGAEWEVEIHAMGLEPARFSLRIPYRRPLVAEDEEGEAEAEREAARWGERLGEAEAVVQTASAALDEGSTACRELRGRVAGVEGRLAELRTRLAELEGRMAARERELQELPTLAGRVGEAARRAFGTMQGLGPLRIEVRALRDEVCRAPQALGGAASPEEHQRLLAAALEAAGRARAGSSTAFGTLARIRAEVEQAATATAGARRLAGGNEDLTRLAGEIAADLAALATALGEARSAEALVQDRLAAAASARGAAAGMVGRLVAEMANTRAAEGLQGRLAHLQNRQVGLESAEQAAVTCRDGVSADLERLQAAAGELRSLHQETAARISGLGSGATGGIDLAALEANEADARATLATAELLTEAIQGFAESAEGCAELARRVPVAQRPEPPEAGAGDGSTSGWGAGSVEEVQPSGTGSGPVGAPGAWGQGEVEEVGTGASMPRATATTPSAIDVTTLIELARVATERCDYRAARAALDQILALRPDHQWAQRNRPRVAAWVERAERSQRALGEASTYLAAGRLEDAFLRLADARSQASPCTQPQIDALWRQARIESERQERAAREERERRDRLAQAEYERARRLREEARAEGLRQLQGALGDLLDMVSGRGGGGPDPAPAPLAGPPGAGSGPTTPAAAPAGTTSRASCVVEQDRGYDLDLANAEVFYILESTFQCASRTIPSYAIRGTGREAGAALPGRKHGPFQTVGEARAALGRLCPPDDRAVGGMQC